MTIKELENLLASAPDYGKVLRFCEESMSSSRDGWDEADCWIDKDGNLRVQ